MKDGYIKVAAASPEIRVADCIYNTASIKKAIDRAYKSNVALLVLPELCVTGYTCDDLFTQRTLLESAQKAVLDIAAYTKGKEMVVVLGAPLEHKGWLYNTAAVLCDGELLGVAPKSYPPNYGEFYEQRYFAEAPVSNEHIEIQGNVYPFGRRLLFSCREVKDFVIGAEICEDLFVTLSPGAYLSLAGATVIANTSASDELVGKPSYRRDLVRVQSRKNISAYVYCNAPTSESTTDLVYSAHNIIAENGYILSESKPFGEGYAETEIDVQSIAGERKRMTSVRKVAWFDGIEVIEFSLKSRETELSRGVEKHPFVPEDPVELATRCEDIFDIQCAGLGRRLEHTGIPKMVLGVSGGLDSTLALLVAARTAQKLGRPASDIIGITMPGFGTTDRTRTNAQKLCEIMGTTFRQIDITASVKQHLQDIGHDGKTTDIAYENAQARERTQILMDVANMENGLVIGTGNLSEQALGWSTYNGDHMSMYAVNNSVPKTLVARLIRYAADQAGGELKEVLYDILDTPISPELLPAQDGKITQKTEDVVGPYELHDFFLFYIVRWGFTPTKVRRLANCAFAGEYTDDEIVKWLRVFTKRFFNNQFKRSCVPNGPKIGSVGLSPRGDWRMPSDASYALWMSYLED